MQKRVLMMLVVALVVVLGLLWTLTSLAPNSERSNKPNTANPDEKTLPIENSSLTLNASIEGAYDAESLPPLPPLPIY